MIPTRRLVLLLLAPMVLGVLAVGEPSLAVPMVAADVVLLGVAVLDGLLATGRVTVERRFGEVQAVGRAFEVVLRLHNAGRRPLDLQVHDQSPGSPEGLPARVRIGSGGHEELTYRCAVPQRGEHAFGPVTVRWRSPLGLMQRQVRHEVPGRVRVYPSFRQLRTWGLMAREDERRAPVRSRRRPGGENEFERLRPYVGGDPYRHVDWRATARRRELITREFGQESNQNVIFLIDAGRMMSARVGEMTAFDHGLDAAMMMGQVALRHGDRVGVLVYDDQVRAWLPPRGGARSGSRLIRGTYDVFPSSREPDHALALRWLAHRVKRRSLVVLITSVVDAVNAESTQAIVSAMASRHLPLCVWMRDPSLEALVTRQPTERRDRFVAGAAAELLATREVELQRLRQRGALVIDAAPDEVTPRLLSRYLEVKARRLL